MTLRDLFEGINFQTRVWHASCQGVSTNICRREHQEAFTITCPLLKCNSCNFSWSGTLTLSLPCGKWLFDRE